MDNDDKIIVDANNKNSAEPTGSANSNASISSLRKEMIKELEKHQNSSANTKETKIDETQDASQKNGKQNDAPEYLQSPKYQDFLDRYEIKSREIVEKPVARYNSELDFRLNQRIKKVRFPKTKTQKMLIAIAVCVCIILASVGLALGLQDRTPPVELINVSLSQPVSNNVYQVNGIYVGDQLNCKNIDLICKYSDGSIIKKNITNDMLKSTSTKFNQDSNSFTESGDVEFELSYQGHTLKINFVVQEYQLEYITLNAPKMGSGYNILATSRTLDLSQSLIVNAHYTNGRTAQIALTQCKYLIGDMTPTQIKNNGKINIEELSNNTTYDVQIIYQEGEISKSAIFKVKTKFE